MAMMKISASFPPPWNGRPYLQRYADKHTKKCQCSYHLKRIVGILWIAVNVIFNYVCKKKEQVFQSIKMQCANHTDVPISRNTDMQGPSGVARKYLGKFEFLGFTLILSVYFFH